MMWRIVAGALLVEYCWCQCSYANDDYVLAWEYTPSDDVITFTLNTRIPPADFWTGVGIGKSMSQLDVLALQVIGNEVIVGDYYTDGFASPILDAQQDVKLIDASVNNGRLTATFSRPINTGDSVQFDQSLAGSELGCVTLQMPETGGSVSRDGLFMKHRKTPKRFDVCNLKTNCVAGASLSMTSHADPLDDNLPQPSSKSINDQSTPVANYDYSLTYENNPNNGVGDYVAPEELTFDSRPPVPFPSTVLMAANRGSQFGGELIAKPATLKNAQQVRQISNIADAYDYYMIGDALPMGRAKSNEHTSKGDRSQSKGKGHQNSRGKSSESSPAKFDVFEPPSKGKGMNSEEKEATDLDQMPDFEPAIDETATEPSFEPVDYSSVVEPPAEEAPPNYYADYAASEPDEEIVVDDNVGACSVASNSGSQFVPQCNDDGTFQALQCDDFVGECWCVQPITGVEVDGTRTSVALDRPDCDAALATDNNNEPENSEGTPEGINQVEPIGATCPPDAIDIDACEPYFTNYFTEVDKWTERQKLPPQSQYARGCKLVKEVDGVKDLCCQHLVSVCQPHLPDVIN